MPNRIFKYIFIFIMPLMSIAQNKTILQVKYLSTENVYINAGKAEGVRVGNKYAIIQDNNRIAEIEVVYAADHSASCKIMSSNAQIQIGDKLELLVSGKSEEAIEVKSDSIGTEQTEIIANKKKLNVKQNKMRISGNLGVQWYHFEDMTGSKLNFNQPSIRFHFRIRELWSKNLNVRIKFRSRYDDRSRSYDNDTPQTEWRNRLYEASFSYDDQSSPVNFKVGRIISNTFSGVGYIDGLQLQHNAGRSWRYGIFAGTQPEWQYSDFQTSIQKYGLYFNYQRGDYSTNLWESTLAFAGAYHGSTVSREFMYLQNNVNYWQRLNVFQSLELDLNRDWRKEKTGQTISMTGLYVSSSYKVTDWLNTGLSYDNRKNYYTYEMRSLADSLFDDAFRQGIRANFNVRFSKDYRFYGNYGWRKRSGEGSNTHSYAAGLNISNLLLSRLSLSARFAGFINYYTTGFNPSVRLSQSFRGGHNISLSYGNYLYTLKANNTNNTNQWARFNTQFELPLRLYLTGSYEYDWGDDVEGQRILAELGYRF